MKKLIAFIIAVCIALSLLSGCGAQSADVDQPVEMRHFTDDLGRTLVVPKNISRVAVSGPLTQIYALPMCLELLVGFSVSYSDGMEKYIPEQYIDLPELGQLYGGKGTMDLEALLAAAPEIVIDIGEPKNNMAEELDALCEQTGIPFIHIDATVETAPHAFRRLGELLNRAEKAEELASWCEETYKNATDMMARIDNAGERKTIMYALGDKGLNTLAEGSFHAETVNLMGNNVAKLKDVTSSGLGNEVDLEQILLWDPEYIVFEFDSGYNYALNDENWGELSAVREGKVFKTPTGPYGWLASPPSVQRYLGILWLGAVMYPEYVEYDLRTEVEEYYKLFYGFEMNDEAYAKLMENAI